MSTGKQQQQQSSTADLGSKQQPSAAAGAAANGWQQQQQQGPKLAGRSLNGCWTCGVERNLRSKHCPFCK
jgi:hypothetical protein